MKTLLNHGYTMIEVLIVVLVVGILSALAIPSYQRSVENSYADQAVAELQIIGTTNRLYNLDNGMWAKSSSSSTPLNSCSPGGTCPATATGDACELIYCGYLTMQNFPQSQYNFFAIGSDKDTSTCSLTGASGTNYLGCAVRINCSSTVSSNCTSNNTYKNWGYTVDVNGTISAWPTGTSSPPPPTS